MVRVKSLELGAGMPKICIPIAERNKAQIVEQAERIAQSSADLAEWRVDFLEAYTSKREVGQIAEALQEILQEIPLVFTFRTAREGGQRALSFSDYRELLCYIADSGYADFIDVEMFCGYEGRTSEFREWKIADRNNCPVKRLVEYLKDKAVIIGSYHDFDKTPSLEEIVRRLLFLDSMGADIPKIAVMPGEREDVLRLMEATSLADRLLIEKPVITMAMGALGAVSRLTGELFGSAVTFGCIGKESAPGQIELGALRQTLELIHDQEGK